MSTEVLSLSSPLENRHPHALEVTGELFFDSNFRFLGLVEKIVDWAKYFFHNQDPLFKDISWFKSALKEAGTTLSGAFLVHDLLRLAADVQDTPAKIVKSLKKVPDKFTGGNFLREATARIYVDAIAPIARTVCSLVQDLNGFKIISIGSWLPPVKALSSFVVLSSSTTKLYYLFEKMNLSNPSFDEMSQIAEHVASIALSFFFLCNMAELFTVAAGVSLVLGSIKVVSKIYNKGKKIASQEQIIQDPNLFLKNVKHKA